MFGSRKTFGFVTVMDLSSIPFCLHFRKIIYALLLLHQHAVMSQPSESCTSAGDHVTSGACQGDVLRTVGEELNMMKQIVARLKQMKSDHEKVLNDLRQKISQSSLCCNLTSDFCCNMTSSDVSPPLNSKLRET